MGFLNLLAVVGATLGAARSILPRHYEVTTFNSTCNSTASFHNFTLTIDLPGFALDGLPVIYANAGIFTNVSVDNAEYQPTYYMKNDTGHMYGTFVTSNGYTAENWIFSAYNGSDSFSGRAELNSPGSLQYDQPSYTGSFFVVGEDENDPWGSNPHIGFLGDDGVGNGSWFACPKWFDDSWRIYAGTADFTGVTSAYPVGFPCTAIGNLKVNLVGEGYGY